jgi:integrase/recombinase XerD
MSSEPRRSPRSWRRLPISAWPELDHRLWHAAQTPTSLLDEGGRASKWRPATVGLVANAYGLWLRWLRHKGRLSGTEPPIARITRARIGDYLADLKTRYSDATIALYLHHLHAMLRAMSADSELAWLAQLARRISARAKPARPKLPRLVDSGVLFAVGLQLMEDARTHSDGLGIGAAVEYRDGLQIAMLACRPLRLGELMALRVDETIRKVESRYVVQLPASVTKNRRELERPYPGELTEAIDFYIHQVRPVLAARKASSAVGSDAFWVSRRGNPMRPGNVSDRIRRLTRKHVGRDLSPHLFRDCAATSVAIKDPRHIGIVKDVLGHATLRTSEKHYNQATSVSGLRRYQMAIKALRDEGG